MSTGWVNTLPTVNATLNGTAAILLAIGWRYIRARNVPAHRTCMLAAFCTSAVFLASYITYHVHRTYISGVGPTPFAGEGWSRPVYFTILISHTILAVLVVPLVLRALYLAWRGRFDRHARIARWTLPIWFYVSVTGVVIYGLLYHVYPPN